MRGVASNSRVVALWSTQFDAGRMQRTAEAPGRVRVELQDFTSPSPELCRLILGYIKGTLGLNDVEDVSVEELSCTTRGDALCAWRELEASRRPSEALPLVAELRRRTR
jgi:predicted hydrocarbon binding protein